MNIQEMEITKIIPYINNPRKNLNIDKVASSIKEFGFQQPIVIDEENIIIVGTGKRVINTVIPALLISGQFKMNGKASDPSVELNILSFSPGILRQIFSKDWLKQAKD